MKSKSMVNGMVVVFSLVGIFSIGSVRAEGEVDTILSELDQKISTLETQISEVKTKFAELKAALGKSEIQACNKADLRNAPVGFTCKTSKGVMYERVDRQGFGEAWKDHNTGITWSGIIGQFNNLGPVIDGKVVVDPKSTDRTAARACQDDGGILPERNDFETGEDNGFREVLPMSDRWFWSS